MLGEVWEMNLALLLGAVAWLSSSCVWCCSWMDLTSVLGWFWCGWQGHVV